jgi:hypothetical protein
MRKGRTPLSMPSGDRYVAMHFGPVASKTYDLLQAARGETSEHISSQLQALVRDSLAVNPEHHVVPQRDADLSSLS